MRLRLEEHSCRKKSGAFSLLILLPLMVMGSMLTSNTARAAEICLTQGSTITLPSGYIADRILDSKYCPNWGQNRNSANLRRVKPGGDIVCLYNNFFVPRGYVVTSTWYDSATCGVNSRRTHNRGTIFQAHDKMNVCVGVSNAIVFKIPTDYRYTGFLSKPGACAMEKVARLEKRTPPPTSANRRGISLSGNGWFQIQIASNYKEVYQGRAKFVELSAGTYNVINLTTGNKRKGVVVR